MTSQEILHADVLDILFDNRNKTYGAYELRKHYKNRMSIALGTMLSAVFISILIASQFSVEKSNIPAIAPDNVVRLIEIDPDVPKPELPHPPPRSAKPIAQTSHTNIKIVPDEKADKLVPDQNDLIKTVISTQTLVGDLTDNAYQPSASSVGSEQPAAKVEEPKPAFDPIEKNAEFPGGQTAWMNFLSKYLRTPDELEAGQKRTVYVRFVVDADGSISKFEIAQSDGAAFDNEVVRVLKKMPKWTPAVQNGHNVSVIFTQPVTFMALEE